jgi:hypothetical protein
MRPAAVDLFCGLGGWSEGLLAEGWKVIGFDIEEHVYGEHRYPGKLVIADVSTLHGSWFKDADLIVASPPCQEFSYMAMPWTRAKAKAAAIRADSTGAEHARLTRLFDACFRIQREACEAAGRHIPMVVENVRGAQPWVGKAAGKYGSFYLWGDVPALMPVAFKGAHKVGVSHQPDGRTNFHHTKYYGTKNTGGSWFNVAHNTTSGKWRNPDGRRLKGCDCAHPETTPSGFAAVSIDCPFHGEVNDGPTITTCFPSPDMIKVPSLDGGRRTDPGNGARFTTRDCGLEAEGVKQRGSGREWFAGEGKISRMTSSKSTGRKMASAMIAKIPEPLSRHIARTFLPVDKQ